MANEAKGMRKRIKLVGLRIKNFYRIEAAELHFDPDRGLYEITGANRAGKTSVLRAIMALILGAKAVSENAVHDGAEDEGGEVSGEFSNGWRIERVATAANPKGALKVVHPDGAKGNQTMVDGWLGNRAISLGSLREKKGPELTDLLLSLARDPGLKRRLTELDQEITLVERERSPWVSQKQKAERTRRPDGERPDPVDVQSELRRLESIQKVGTNRAAASRAYDDRARERDLAVDAEKLAVQAVKEAEAALARARAAVNQAVERRVESEERVIKALADLNDYPDLTVEEKEVRDRIAEAGAVDRALDPWKAWDRAQVEIEEARREIGLANDLITAAKAERKALLSDAGIPVRGLSFTEDGEPLLAGRPLDLASGSEWVHFEVDVALALDPQLGLVLLDEEANGVDRNGMAALCERMEEHGLTVFACRIEPSGAGEVVVCEGGRAWNGRKGGT